MQKWISSLAAVAVCGIALATFAGSPAYAQSGGDPKPMIAFQAVQVQSVNVQAGGQAAAQSVAQLLLGSIHIGWSDAAWTLNAHDQQNNKLVLFGVSLPNDTKWDGKALHVRGKILNTPFSSSLADAEFAGQITIRQDNMLQADLRVTKGSGGGGGFPPFPGAPGGSPGGGVDVSISLLLKHIWSAQGQ